jgi:hypothetical protein
MSRYIDLSVSQQGSSFNLNLNERNNYYTFYMFNSSFSISMTEIEANYHYLLAASIMTQGAKYWENFRLVGGDSYGHLNWEFKSFVDNNIKWFDRDKKINEIIEKESV